jgi:hypothetical protein
VRAEARKVLDDLITVPSLVEALWTRKRSQQLKQVLIPLRTNPCLLQSEGKEFGIINLPAGAWMVF